MRALIVQAGTVVFGRGVIRVAQLFAFLILANALTPSEFGWYGILTSTVALAAVLGNLGLRQSFAYEIGNGRLTAGEAVGTSLLLWPVLTAFSAGVIFLLYGRSLEGIAPSIAAIIIVASVAGAMLQTFLQGVFLGNGRIWAFSVSESLPQVFLAVAILILLVISGLTLEASLWAQAGSFLLAAPFVLAIALWRPGRWGTAFRRLGPMIRYGLIFALNVFMVLLCSRISMFIIEVVWGSDAAGQFFAAIRVNEIFLEVATALGMVLFARAARTGNAVSSIQSGVTIASWMFWFFAIVAVAVASFAPLVIGILLGEDYTEAVPVLQILAISLAPTAACRVIYPSIAGGGRPLFGTPAILASLMLTSGLALLLVPLWGATGGAWSIVVGQTLLYTAYAVVCRIRYNMRVRDFFIPDFRPLSRTALGLWRRGRAE